MPGFLDNLLAKAMGKEAPATPGTEKNGEPHAPSQGEIMKANAAVGGSDADKTRKEKEADIWAAKPKESPTSKPVFAPTDSKAFSEAVSQLDFTQVIPKELFDKAKEGDSEALQQMLNLAAQASYSAAAESSKALLTEADNTRMSQMEERMMGMMQKYAQSQSIEKVNPAFKNPKYAPILDMYKKQLSVAHPDATPEELAKHAERYLKEMLDDVYDGSAEGRARAQKKQVLQNEKPLAAQWLNDA